MNSLSLMIYLIGFADNLSSFLIFMSILTGIIVIASTGIRSNANDTFTRPRTLYCFLFMFFCVFKIFIPSTQTMTLIAASEVTDRVINSEKFGKVVDTTVNTTVAPAMELLQNWIKKTNADILADISKKK